MKSLLLTAIFLTLPAAAGDFGVRYPAGSIRDSQQAQTALKDAEAEMARIAGSAKSREADCYKGLLVNSCRDEVRREKKLAEREVWRVRVEARDLQRKVDAEALARRRAEEAEARDAQSAERLKKQQQANAKGGASPRRDAAEKLQRDPVNKNDESAERLRTAQERLSAAERAENARKFQQKQEQAAKRAQEKEAERVANEERRAEKRRQVEKREAEREAIRQKAGELEKKV